MAIKRVSTLGFPKGYSVKSSGVSQTQCRNFMECRVKWLLYINGMQPKEGIVTTTFGEVFHFFLETMYKQMRNGGFNPQKVCVEDWLKQFRFEYEIGDEQSFEDAGASACSVFLAYMKHYEGDLTNAKFVGVEDEVKTMKDGFFRKVKPDAVYEDTKKGLWYMEHKTRGRIDEENIDLTLSMDFQTLWTVTTLEQLMKREFKGVLYNIIRSPQLRRGKEETRKDFVERIYTDAMSRPEFYFIRREISYTKKDKERFNSTEANRLLTDMLLAQKENNIYRNPFACSGRYGHFCEYLQACATDNMSYLKYVERT
jgi:hypothetical protein